MSLFLLAIAFFGMTLAVVPSKIVIATCVEVFDIHGLVYEGTVFLSDLLEGYFQVSILIRSSLLLLLLHLATAFRGQTVSQICSLQVQLALSFTAVLRCWLVF